MTKSVLVWLTFFSLVASAGELQIKIHEPGGETKTFEQALAQPQSIVLGKSGWICSPNFSESQKGRSKSVLLECHMGASKLPGVLVTAGCNDSSMFLDSTPSIAKLLPELQDRDLGLSGKDGNIWRLEIKCLP